MLTLYAAFSLDCLGFNVRLEDARNAAAGSIVLCIALLCACLCDLVCVCVLF